MFNVKNQKDCKLNEGISVKYNFFGVYHLKIQNALTKWNKFFRKIFFPLDRKKLARWKKIEKFQFDFLCLSSQMAFYGNIIASAGKKLRQKFLLAKEVNILGIREFFCCCSCWLVLFHLWVGNRCSSNRNMCFISFYLYKRIFFVLAVTVFIVAIN